MHSYASLQTETARRVLGFHHAPPEAEHRQGAARSERVERISSEALAMFALAPKGREREIAKDWARSALTEVALAKY